MVGYNDNEEEHLSELWHGMAGILSGMTTRFLTQPFDVLKIRFQLQHEPLMPGQDHYYWSLRQASKRIFKEESYRALWKGHVPAQLLSGVYGLVQFGTFEYFTKIAHPYVEDDYKTIVHFVCGSMSGAAATVLSLPFDTIRTRLVGQGEPKLYGGVSNALVTMVAKEGPLSLYKGLSPALLSIIPLSGMQFAAFRVFSTILNNLEEKHDKIPFFNNIVCGSAAGVVAKLTVYPFDLAKKRLQVQGFEVARHKFGKVKKFHGTFHCLKVTFLEENFTGLYKGISPSLLKAVVTSGLMFGLYEEILGKIRKFVL